MSPMWLPTVAAAIPAASALRVTSDSRIASALPVPTTYVRAASETQPSSTAPQSIEIRSPSARA